MFFITRTCLIFFLLTPVVSWGIDLQPNDIVAPKPGNQYVSLSYYNSQYSNLYRNGAVVTAPAKFKSPVINSTSAILRLSASYELGDYIGVSFLQLPYGTVKPAGSLATTPSTTGTGDLAFATAFWPYMNRNTRTYLAVAGYFFAPTGSQSNQSYAIAESRYRSDLQIGFQKPITDSVDGMIAVDTMWFGGTSQCGAACGYGYNVALNQKPLTTTQLGPIYKINQTYTVGASYFYVAGGAMTVNNAYLNNVANTQRYLLSGQANYPFGRITFQYGRDMDIKNGFFQSNVIAVRYQKKF